MQSIIAPTHVAAYCSNDEHDSSFQQIKREYGGDFSYVYKARCDCNNTKFFCYIDNHPSLYADCSQCNKRIVVYDLSQYPAACRLKKEYDLKRVNMHESELYINYEYSDEYLFEDDVAFDNNDITWARAFIKCNSKIIKILDDETA